MNRIDPTPFFLGLMACLLSGVCLAQQPARQKKDDITYFQSLPGDSTQLAVDSTPVFRIQPGTELNILVATMNEEADNLFNPRMVQQSVSSINKDSKQIAGYITDGKGFINFPIIGRVNLLNLTTQEAADTLMKRLSKQVNNPYVTVRVVNFQVTVMGEVGAPGLLNVSRERVTLPEVISLSGDLTIYGKRENILVVREQNGKRTFGRVDLHDRSVFRSPYYYLQPNDLVYVEPKRSKKILVGRVFPYLPTIFASVSLLITVFANVIR